MEKFYGGDWKMRRQVDILISTIEDSSVILFIYYLFVFECYDGVRKEKDEEQGKNKREAK